MEKILKFFRKKEIVILMLIVLVGICLRSYNFFDWLRFNDDQVRDALVINQMVSGENFPLLGPKAGGTTFNLGPAFYYIEYFSALAFGNYPDKLAYPVLIFSIFSIPLFFLIFKKIFDAKIALMLTALFSFSSFAIKYSRFSWNINLAPFFILAYIYSLYRTLKSDRENKFFWAIICGIIVGIGVQIHTILLFSFPLMLLIISAYFFKKKTGDFRKVFVILAIAAILNLPMVMSEIGSHGENSRAFLRGISSKSDENLSFIKKVASSVSCNIQGNSFVLSSYGNNDGCDIFATNKEISKLSWFFNMILSSLFFFGGIFIVFQFLKKDSDLKKNIMLKLMFIYYVIASVVFIPLAGEISLRMFLLLIFIPFILLGFWFRSLLDKFAGRGTIASLSILVLLLASNAVFFGRTYFAIGEMYRDDQYFGGASLGEMEKISRYVVENSLDSKIASISRFENSRSLEYLVEKKGVDVEIRSEDEEISERSFYFFVKKNDFRIDKKRNKDLEKDLVMFNQLDSKIIGQYTVFKLSRKK
jgi:4-amino-4-deoxy-L-arabinose transferase-like glycosyltransferase